MNREENQGPKEAPVEKKRPAGTAYEIEVGGKVGYLKKIDRGTLSAAFSKAANMVSPDMIGGGQIILDSCWLGGDEEIRTDEELNIGACMACYELIDIKQATIKKV